MFHTCVRHLLAQTSPRPCPAVGLPGKPIGHDFPAPWRANLAALRSALGMTDADVVSLVRRQPLVLRKVSALWSCCAAPRCGRRRSGWPPSSRLFTAPSAALL